jgi:hypothetical protein
MEYFIGFTLALAVAALGRFVGFQKDRAFYPTVLIIVGSYYVLFGAMAASAKTLAIEIAVAAAFLIAAVVGFKSSAWLVAAALAGHGVFDSLHSRLINNPGVPGWWPGFCLSFDVTIGVVLAVILYRGTTRPTLAHS